MKRNIVVCRIEPERCPREMDLFRKNSLDFFVPCNFIRHCKSRSLSADTMNLLYI